MERKTESNVQHNIAMTSKFLFYVCKYFAGMYIDAPCVYNANRGQKRYGWMPTCGYWEPKPESSEKATIALNC